MFRTILRCRVATMHYHAIRPAAINCTGRLAEITLHAIIRSELLPLRRDDPHAQCVLGAMVLCLLAGRPPPAISMSITSPATTRISACTRGARATPPAPCGRSPRPCDWPRRAIASCWPTRRAVPRVRFPGRHPAQRRGPAMPFILDGNGATLDGSAPMPARRLDPLPRQHLSLPPPVADPARPVLERPSIPPLPLPRGPLSRRGWNRCNGARWKGRSTSPSKPASCRPTIS